MTVWNDKTARDYLQQLANACDGLKKEDRHSIAWTRWKLNAMAALEEIFGKKSRHYRTFAAISWSKSGQIFIDTDEMRRTHNYQMEGANDFVQRKHQEAAVAQLGVAQGIILAALDELSRKGISGVFVHEESGQEASALLRIIKLAERQWRKTLRVKPTTEKEVQDALENLLIGAELPYRRESDSFPFASKSYRPDFTLDDLGLAIELKLCPDANREKSLIAEINDDIVAYSTRYKNIIFAVYDLGFIRDVDRFCSDFESKSGVIVRVIKH